MIHAAELRAKIRDIKDFPTEGILFADIATLLKDAPGFGYVRDRLAERYEHERVAVVRWWSRAASVLLRPPVYACGRAAMEPPP